MKHRMHVFITVILALTLAACQASAPSVTPTNSPVPTETPTPTSTPLPTDTPTATPTATPLPSPETLSPQAAELCEAALTKPVLNQPFSSPVMAMSKETYADQPKWNYFFLFPYFTAQSASEVKTVFCIEQGRSKTSSYTDGEPGYRRSWSVRVVELESGNALAAKAFQGGEPPYFKQNRGPAYGNQPTKELFTWAMESLHDKSVLFVEEAVAALVFFPGGKHIAAGTTYRLNVTYSGTVFNAKVFIFDAETGEVVHTLSAHTRPITELAVSPDGRLLASNGYAGSNDMQGLVKIWDVESGRELYSLKTDTNVAGLAFSSDSQTLAISEYEKISLVDTTNGEIVNTIEPGGWRIFFTPDNALAVNIFVGDSQQINFIDPRDGKVISTVNHPCFQGASPDGRSMAMCNEDGTTSIITTDAEQNTIILPFTAPNSVVALSSNGLFAASPENEKNDVQVWDINTSQMLFHFSDSPAALALSPDGRLLASGGDNGFIKIWEIPTP